MARVEDDRQRTFSGVRYPREFELQGGSVAAPRLVPLIEVGPLVPEERAPGEDCDPHHAGSGGCPWAGGPPGLCAAAAAPGTATSRSIRLPLQLRRGQSSTSHRFSVADDPAPTPRFLRSRATCRAAPARESMTFCGVRRRPRRSALDFPPPGAVSAVASFSQTTATPPHPTKGHALHIVKSSRTSRPHSPGENIGHIAAGPAGVLLVGA